MVTMTTTVEVTMGVTEVMTAVTEATTIID
jgi:hypothetical protein